MSGRFCVSCGSEIESENPEVVLCPDCGGSPEQLTAPSKTAHQPDQTERIGTVRQEGDGTHQQPDPPAAGRSFFSQAALPLTWEPGDTILDLYEVKQRIETGGMAVVYQVHHKAWNMDLAVKTPRKEKIDTGEGLSTFISEAEAWINLGLHPHIVSCHYVRRLGSEAFPRVFAEWVAGGSLLEWIGAGRLPGLPEKLDAAIQFAWGLAYAHERGLVHKDVKPENVLLSEAGALKITDFGLANARGNYYTLPYASPEQIRGQPTDLKTDLWSWAVSILHLLLGERTWNEGSIAGAVLEDALTNGLQLPPDLGDLLRECFQDDPGERPAGMKSVADRLIEIYRAVSGDPYPRELPEPADLRAGSLNNRALSMLDLGREIDAAKFWEEALEIDERHPASTFNYGVIRWRNALITDEELINQLEFSLSSNPMDWQAYYNLGMAHVERGDIEAAAAFFRKIPEITQDDPGVLEAPLSIKSLSRGVTCTRTIQVEHHTSAAIMERGALVGTVGQLSLPTVWNLQSGKSILHINLGLEELEPELPVISISPDGNYIFEGGYSTIRLWDRRVIRRAAAPQQKKPHIFDTFSPLRALAISPDNRHALSGNREGTVALYNLEERREIDYLPEHNRDVRFVGFSSDGRWGISGGDDGRINISSIAGGEVIHTLSGPAVWSAAISDDARWIAAACRDHTVRVWDLETKICSRIFQGHKDEVRSVAISADSQIVLSGSADHSIRIWDLMSGRCLRTLDNHTASVHAVFFLSENEDRLEALSAAENGEIKIWGLADLGVNPGYWSVSIPTSYSEAEALSRAGKTKVEEIRSGASWMKSHRESHELP